MGSRSEEWKKIQETGNTETRYMYLYFFSIFVICYMYLIAILVAWLI